MKNTKILWFTGLSGSGKSTVTDALVKRFEEKGKSFIVFDGDDVREKKHKHLGFTREDIQENNRLIGKICESVLGEYDFILVPIISPFKISRELARNKFKESFIETYFDCPYEKCEERDVKGLYARARDGKLENFIGLKIPYEKPENPEITLRTYKESIEESVDKILNFLGI